MTLILDAAREVVAALDSQTPPDGCRYRFLIENFGHQWARELLLVTNRLLELAESRSEIIEQRNGYYAQQKRYREALEWYANPMRPWDHTTALAALENTP